MNREIADLRQNYEMSHLHRKDLAPEPIAQFQAWFKEAQDRDIIEPNAMVLSTLGLDGYPSARVVLLKDIYEGGMVFYTNYDSQKGQELEHSGRASLTFLWKKLERQVRIKGSVRKIPRARTNAYFSTRPHSSQIGAYVSPQSDVIVDRSILDDEKRRLLALHPEGQALSAPDNWGGYELIPHEMEFWQGRPSRLHDRFRYRMDGGAWLIERLAP